MENPLLLSLRAAKQAAAEAPQTVAERLREVRQVLSASSPVVATRPALEVLSRLGKIADYEVLWEITEVYALLAKTVPRNEPVLQIELSNSILLLADAYSGSELSFRLRHTGLELLVELLKSARLTAAQRAAVQSIVSKVPRSDLEAQLATIERELRVGNLFSLHSLVDFLSSTSGLRDQLDLFGTKVFAVLSGLQGKSDPGMLVTVFKLLDQIVFPVYYSVQLPQQMRPALFRNSASRLLTENENCFYSALSALKLLIKGGMTKPLVALIRRLWVIYPGLRTNLYETATAVMQALAQDGSETQRGSAAAFLYWLRHSPEVETEFRTMVDALRDVDRLTKLRQYCSDTMSLFPDAEVPTPLESLQIFAGYPIAAAIPPGERFTYVVDIPESGCILFWAFATEQGDISYTITEMGEETIIKQETRAKTETVPVIGSVVVPRAGFVRFEWDNSFSWFREKQLRFRITVLQPHCEAESSFPAFSAPIEVIRRDETNEKGEDNACYGEEAADVLEIGVQIAGEEARLKCRDTVTTANVAQLREAAGRLLSEVVNSMPNPPKYKKLGIVEKSPQERSGFEDFGTVAVARDVDALALFSHWRLKTVHTLIAVVQDDGVRSAVVIRGKLLVSEVGTPLGDLARMNAESLSEGVALLLSCFGPAELVFFARDVSISSLRESVKALVSPTVLAHCSLREAEFGREALLETATKLNHLHHEFKSSF